MDPFLIPSKNPSLNSLEQWRKGVWPALNPARRFRHTANLKIRREAQAEREFKITILATQAALLFIGKRFAVTTEQLRCIRDNPELYVRLGCLEGIAAKLDVHSLEQGIHGSEVDTEERSKEFGLNKFDEKPSHGFLFYVWEALQNVTLVILEICAVISLAVSIPTEGLSQGWYDGGGILITILIVVFISAASDYSQSLQFQDIEKEKNKIKVEVIRNNTRKIVLIHDIVVGDVVHLSAGDRVPGDGILISGYSLTIDQSSLTGESNPVHPSKSEPFLFSGTMVQNGSGKMLVTAVGMRTEWGRLMAMFNEGGENETPLQVRLNGVATVVGKIGLLFALLTFLVLLIRFFIARYEEGFSHWKTAYLLEIVNDFAIAVSILVVAVPEGLPLAVTLSLAYAMKRMMNDKVLVRNLSACETMGSSTCICSDKTGTLTTNHMAVVKICCGGLVDVPEKAGLNLSEEVSDIFLEGIFLNTSGDVEEHAGQCKIHGSPTESSILELGLSLGRSFHEVRSRNEIVLVEPFSSEEKRMSVLVKLRDGKYRSHCKGASEIVLRMCSHKLNETGVSVPLDSMETQKLECVISSFADEALRTLCFAYKELDGLPERGKEIPKTGLTFVAIVGIKDPVRPGVNDAVNICFKAGIRVRMVTGDNLKTAMAIARECNILTDDGLAIEGYVFRRWSLEEKSKNIPRLQVKVVWDKMATVGQVDMCELVLMALHRLTYKLQELCYDYNCWSRMESIAALLSSYTLPNW